jgi:hypothetical protein
MRNKKQLQAFVRKQKELKKKLGNYKNRSAIKKDIKAVGGIGLPSKMPGYAYGLSAERCITGSKLREIPGSICHGCYAMGANYQYPSVKGAHEARFESLSDLEAWTDSMSNILAYLGTLLPKAERYWRWHDSGDLQGIEHLDAIVQVAIRNPEWRFWIPTKEYAMVRKYKERGAFPGNLAVRVSAPMLNKACPGALQNLTGLYSTVGHDEEERCPAYDQAGFCGTCRKCWDVEEACTDYPKHQ